MKTHKKYFLYLLFLLVPVLTCGCSRAEMNAQIAESIGTLGMYENNEPVETPKMKARREMNESHAVIESNVSEHVEKAARLAASYDYAKALDELALIGENYQDDERVISSKIEYQRLQNLMVQFKGDIAHFSVNSLIVDPARAFRSDSSYTYNAAYLTLEEFKKILQSLYDNNYILMDIHDVVVEIENEDGTKSFALNHPTVPKDKTPIILSFTEANYYSQNDGNGFSERMVTADDGTVQNEYTDAAGNKLTGAYDVVPVVNEFVEQHPDFSLRGAKGIISVTGSQGVFGYGIETGGQTIRSIAERLKEDGWSIACGGYSGAAMDSEMDGDEFIEDMEDWSTRVGSLTGQTDMLIYPAGEEVMTGGLKQLWLLENGYKFFFSLWANSDYLEVNSDYVRQTRRTLNGYNLYYYGDSMSAFFDAKMIRDSSRPAME